MIKASVIILNYLKSKRVTQNVESILAQITDFEMEVVIVDNSCSKEHASQLQELAKHPNVHVHINSINIGYPRGINQGATHAVGQYLLIVNPDIIWRDPSTLQTCINFMEKNPQVGICGPKQINENNQKITMSVRAFPKFHLQVARRTFLRNLPYFKQKVAHDEMQHLDYEQIQPVDWLQSSFWVIRKSLWVNLGGLNEDYQIFMSDPDFCFKCWNEGYEVVYLPTTTVYADGLRCSEGGITDYFRKWTLRQHVKDAVKYKWKHLFKGNPRNLYFEQQKRAK